MQCFVVISPPHSSLAQEQVDLVFGERSLKISDGVWFVAANKTSYQVSEELGISEDVH